MPPAGGEDAYVDTPLITNRLRFRSELSGRASGNFGVYRTWLRLDATLVECRCSCPSTQAPCKHVIGLEQTWRMNPESFLDLDAFIDELRERPREELLQMFGQLVIRWPQVLALLGLPGFERDATEDADADEKLCDYSKKR